MAAQDFDLLVQIISSRSGDEPLEVEHQPRIVPGRSRKRQLYLCPVRISLAPDHRAPARIEFIERPVLLSQPIAKRRATTLAETFRILIVEFVINLPANNVGVIAIVRGQRVDDFSRQLAIGLTVVTILAARLIVCWTACLK